MITRDLRGFENLEGLKGFLGFLRRQPLLNYLQV